MSSSKPQTEHLRTLVQRAVKSKHSRTVKELADTILTEYIYEDIDFVTVVKDLVREGSLVLREPKRDAESVIDYLLKPTLSAWLWITFFGTALAVLAVLLTPDVFPIAIIRWMLGSILVLFMPGYAFIEFLFPRTLRLGSLERFALNVGLSLALVPLIGLLLNYSPWGIRLVPITVTLAGLSVGFATGAAVRKYLGIRGQMNP